MPGGLPESADESLQEDLDSFVEDPFARKPTPPPAIPEGKEAQPAPAVYQQDQEPVGERAPYTPRPRQQPVELGSTDLLICVNGVLQTVTVATP